MADTGTDERQLIEEVLNGSRDQFKVLVDRYAPMVFYIVRQFANDEDLVEELAQQIFVKTYKRLQSFDRRSKFSSWLYTIAKNHCRDYAKNIRRKNKRFSEMESRELQSLMSGSESTDRGIRLQETEELLKKALQHINPDYAEAFLMKYRNDMTYQAMSDRLEASVSALKVRVHRARKELKKFIEENR